MLNRSELTKFFNFLVFFLGTDKLRHVWKLKDAKKPFKVHVVL